MEKLLLLTNHAESFNSINEPKRKRAEIIEKPNHVLLFTVINPAYPITVDVIHTICTPIGQVLRIVIFKKNGVQAMVEFDSVETAKRAKENLHGADIYSGCCTLKIEYAKPTKLNVSKNDIESWDYTNPNLGECDPRWNGDKQKRRKQVESVGNRPAPLLADPRFGAGPQPFRGGNDGMRGPGNFLDYDEPGFHGESGFGDHFAERYPPGPMERLNNRGYMMGAQAGPPPPHGREPLVGAHGGPPAIRGTFAGATTGAPPLAAHGPPGADASNSGGAVMMVYGLNKEKSNPDILFNLFCLYGNVVRVKFLKTKEGCAMIQMGDNLAVERCIWYLNNKTVLGSRIQLGFSKQAYLSDVVQPYTLPDSSFSFKDFMGNKNNRFINPAMAVKNRIQGPSKILHFFNTPPNVKEDTLFEVFENFDAPKPKTIKLFPMKGDKSSTGLMEFDDVTEAIDALVLCNHASIKNHGGRFPYVMKLCFSSNRTTEMNGRGVGGGGGMGASPFNNNKNKNNNNMDMDGHHGNMD
ncbi:heterogeneous nuclear ribonucleoprotein L isoform X3 [Nilaparvata lugens]|uniref:heterogeneous nuclear ribonucleoprotein L isoform X3 n=1 Tax=Nilaparvata lugens TaxID=108931 RepID=UPI00193D3C62|nr:heterogeneous nuclear ribonucleoprotein L isoform X3 [Nilaparvata lugens]